jgi:hypothetical protein
MFSVMFSSYGVLALDDLLKGHKMNGEHFCDVALEEARWAVTPITYYREKWN